MKKLILVLVISSALPLLAGAKNVTAYFSYCSFDVPGSLPYIETYLNVIGSSVMFVPAEDNVRKGEIEVQWIIKSGEKIVHFDKYNLLSPAVTASDSIMPDFIDLQRVNIEPGSYHIELSIRDKNSDSKAMTLSQDIKIGYPADTLSISDIEFVESYTKSVSTGMFSKSGYDIIPFVNSFYPKEITSLKFYAEIYRTDLSPGDDYLVRYYISTKENQQLLDNYAASLKQSPKKINVIIGDFNISDLGSGNFYLTIEIRNKHNQLIAFKQAFFQRSNERNKPQVTTDITAIDVTNTFVSSFYNADSLVDYIACLYPISSGLENEIGENQIDQKNVHAMQQYLYYFWSTRNPENPEKGWLDYRQEVYKANASFQMLNKKGYETDRGRVFLEYGPPNIISEDKEDVNAYPYEIWQYYKIKTQSNRKFVFSSTDRSSNDYRLVHSDAIGEIQDPQWELNLHKRTQQFGNDMDQNNSIDTYGSHTKENYQNPH